MAACLAFLALVIWPAWQYAADERAITTPALEISNLWRAAALPIGIAADGRLRVLRMLRSTTRKDAAVAIVAVLAIVAVFWLLGPPLAKLGRLNLLIFFVGVAGGSVLAGIPIAFAFGLGTFGYLALTTFTPLTVVVGRMDEGMSHLILLAVPLFVFLGLLIEMTGMARAMIAFLGGLLGHVKRRPVVRAGRRDVSRLGHLRREGRRHGGGRAGAVSRDEGARRRRRANWSRCSRPPARRPRPCRRAWCSSPSARSPASRSPRSSPAACCRRWCSAWCCASSCAIAPRHEDLSAIASRAAPRRGAALRRSPCRRWRCRS